MIVIEFPVVTNTEHMLLQPVRGSLSDASGFSVSVFLDVHGRLFEMETCMFFFFGVLDVLSYIKATFYPKFENEKTDQEIPTITYTGDNSILFDAPEGSLMLSVDSSQECEPTDLTPAKRRGTVIDNLDETFDENSVSRTPCSTRIKKEKTDKSG
ncbi:hypothetical protein IGI04_017913 [Brassica rapa subsp. trilocularis]|uniref:Uncharacterized protein n=1 Tax=Brassica rapa subsp. trilocularis TaxID=1813537 RepID=A0ABQ7MBE5_BRACM|nr:hypothetical protein IGI04_017913 [Brassica rapa subsp. trilocularis]